MKYNNYFKKKATLLLSAISGLLMVSCSSYQSASFDDDGIYNSETRVIAANEVEEPQNSNAKYYEEYLW